MPHNRGMKIQVAYTDGTFGEIPGVKWHPEYSRHTDQFHTVVTPGGLWITEDKLFEHLRSVNERREKMGVEPRPLNVPRDCHELIAFASAPFEVYVATSDGTPWKDNGTLVKSIHYGGDDQFWDRY